MIGAAHLEMKSVQKPKKVLPHAVRIVSRMAELAMRQPAVTPP